MPHLSKTDYDDPDNDERSGYDEGADEFQMAMERDSEISAERYDYQNGMALSEEDGWFYSDNDEDF